MKVRENYRERGREEGIERERGRQRDRQMKQRDGDFFAVIQSSDAHTARVVPG